MVIPVDRHAAEMRFLQSLWPCHCSEGSEAKMSRGLLCRPPSDHNRSGTAVQQKKVS